MQFHFEVVLVEYVLFPDVLFLGERRVEEVAVMMEMMAGRCCVLVVHVLKRTENVDRMEVSVVETAVEMKERVLLYVYGIPIEGTSSRYSLTV
jgi:hypothetical protein